MDYLDIIYLVISEFRDVLLAIITIGVTYLLFKKQQKITELSFTEEIFNLFSVSENIKSDLKILYKDSIVDNIHLMKIKIKNTGNMDISTSDYEENIKIVLGDGSNMMDVKILEKHPESLDIKYKINNENCMIIDPMLLNSEDSFLIQSLIRNYNGYMINGRIKGVKTIRKYTGPPEYQYVLGGLACLILSLGPYSVGMIVLFNALPNSILSRIGFVLLTGLYVYILIKNSDLIYKFLPKPKM